jgi:hypothetical protein
MMIMIIRLTMAMTTMMMFAIKSLMVMMVLRIIKRIDGFDDDGD